MVVCIKAAQLDRPPPHIGLKVCKKGVRDETLDGPQLM